jgi:Holliday junction DNA helicase RuvB
MSQKENIIAPHQLEDDDLVSLRPLSLDDFIGQDGIKENLRVFIKSASQRQEAMDHVLLSGPPGLGKTTLAQIIANELKVPFKATSAPMITKSGDLAAILTNLEKNEVLFIDEIHRLNPAIEEILYSAMEDFKLDLIIGEGPAARSVRIDLPPFTLIGATTRSGLLQTPLRERFGIPLRLDFYPATDLQKIVRRNAGILKYEIEDEGCLEIAKRSRGTPRIAGRLLKRVRDFALVADSNVITKHIADSSLTRLEVDKIGLDEQDRKYLACLINKYSGGPVGIETMAAALSEARDTLEEVIEPFLMQEGLVKRTPRGRMATSGAYNHLGLVEPKRVQAPELFE